MIDWNTFWINIFTGGIFFILGLIFSLWLIPKFTIRQLKQKNINHFRTKIAFIISEFCDFLNQVPNEIQLDNDDMTKFLVRNKKYPDLFDFVALLKPNVLAPQAAEKLKLNILTCLTEYSGNERYNLVNAEVKRLTTLQNSLENILAAHSLIMDDKIISSISTLCIEIRIMVNEFRYNEMCEELMGEKEVVFGAKRLIQIYDIIIELLRSLEKENEIKRE